VIVNIGGLLAGVKHVNKKMAKNWGAERGVTTPTWTSILDHNPSVKREGHLVKQGPHAPGRISFD
jgi:hypothetical protein